MESINPISRYQSNFTRHCNMNGAKFTRDEHTDNIVDIDKIYSFNNNVACT